MICYVDIEHKKALQSVERHMAHRDYCARVKKRLEEIAGETCLVQRYERVTQQWLQEMRVRALIIGGMTTEWADYGETDLAEMLRVIRSAERPVLGVCAGCHLIAMAHGAPLGPIRRLEEEEEDPGQDYKPGYFKEWGFMPVRVLKSEPLFDGLGKMPCFLEAHYWEIKEVPPGFELLASSESCRVQAIRQVGQPVYGTQFHPEAYTEGQIDHHCWPLTLVYPAGYTEEQLDGRRLLVNFFRVSGVL
jgi:GMP synthase-like glutamine amidotransferase